MDKVRPIQAAEWSQERDQQAELRTYFMWKKKGYLKKCVYGIMIFIGNV